MSFHDVYNQLNPDQLRLEINSKQQSDVEVALAKTKLDINDFQALISPAAAPYLETMARRSQQLTRQRFGNTMQLYIPLYLSNKCTNICTYCGFSLGNKIRRKTLSMEELDQEIAAIKAMGFEHILIVTGEADGTVGMDYFREVMPHLRKHFAHISFEVQPLDQADYEELIELGLNAVLVYQETYQREPYARFHLRGSKQDFDYRLDTADRLGKAGVEKIGIGSLLGLDEWRLDNLYTAFHLDYLEKTYWRTRYSLSVPRLRPCEGSFSPEHPVSERQLLQLICAWRLFKPELEISLSTRESARFRDNVMSLGVTTMSAWSSTHPGGYANRDESLEQFSIDDNRRPDEVAVAIREKGLEPVWKDWDTSLSA
ncbi:2-iminoacetate synthase ThiH [Spongorhabdus nitratireducens]